LGIGCVGARPRHVTELCANARSLNQDPAVIHGPEVIVSDQSVEYGEGVPMAFLAQESTREKYAARCA